ncbi:response regulator [Sedimenticola selenatireducens]|mgnify:CR=1 FL=1|uniref:Response regulator n=1 Tax=Sedimenticola selenatireducens TaxID=191960 RepID=A0A558DTR1_9GAMM|nr:response regulator [Sedimenticola selenatireducens]TVO76971.1 response regulator [Sedimenticola selenatireducens]TVT64414.1 MAG: response regulator [Sedimenticola selenatireducens]
MSNHPRHLLIVEDNHSLRQMLTWEFEDLGYQVTATDCCGAARAACERQTIDLALLDYNLPDGCGTDLISDLRSINPDIQIVICSGRTNGHLIDSSLYRFEPKPVTAKKLHDLFEAVKKMAAH